MDWFKVDVLDILNSGLSDKEIGQLVNYMALISLKERLPNKNELKTIIRPSSFKKLEDLLNKNEKKLNFYEEKVMKNIENINKFREKDKEKKRKLRGSSYSNDEVVPQDKPGDVPPMCPPVCPPPCPPHRVRVRVREEEEKAAVATTKKKPKNEKAAAAFTKSLAPEKPEPEGLDSREKKPEPLSRQLTETIGKIMLLRINAKKKTGQPIDSRRGYEKRLEKAYRDDPEGSVEQWKEEIEEAEMKKNSTTSWKNEFVVVKKASSFPKSEEVRKAL